MSSLSRRSDEVPYATVLVPLRVIAPTATLAAKSVNWSIVDVVSDPAGPVENRQQFVPAPGSAATLNFTAAVRVPIATLPPPGFSIKSRAAVPALMACIQL